MTAPPDDKLSVEAARDEFRKANAENEQILRPLVEAYLQAHEAIITDLRRAHSMVADQSDLDLVGPTREGARWLITGRCIGLAQAAVDLLRLGYANETIPTVRALHEGTRLLSVVGLPGEDALVERWIAGKDIRRNDIMKASDRRSRRSAPTCSGVASSRPT